MKNDVIELLTIELQTDKDGFEQEVVNSMEIMAEINSVKRSEFYRAAREGINVQLAAVINLDDLKEAIITGENGKKKRPTRVRYDGIDYKIVRTYKTSKTRVELTLQEVE